MLKSWSIDTAIYYYAKRDVYRVREREKASDSMHPIETKIKELPKGSVYVYDLSVENTEIFIFFRHCTSQKPIPNSSEEVLWTNYK